MTNREQEMRTREDITEWNRKRRALMLDEDVRVELKIRIDKSGLGQNEWARQNNIDQHNLSDVLCQRGGYWTTHSEAAWHRERVVAFRKI